MKIFNFLKSDNYESDDSDDIESADAISYFDDDPDHDLAHEADTKVGPNSFLVKAVIALLAVTGVAYAVNVSIGGGGGKIEFAQGFTTVAACDTDGITVIPQAGYVNDSGTGKFTLDSVILENISASCFGNKFIIQVFGDVGAALTTSESATSGVYTQYDAASFIYTDSATVTSTDGIYNYYNVLTDLTGNEATTGLNSVQISFDPDQTISFANSSDVRKITIQTLKP